MIDYNTIAQILIDQITEEWIAQGHSLTGSFEQGLTSRISKTSDGVKIQIIDTTDAGYGKILDEGVPASKIPYTPGGGRRGGKSKYIQGLIEYAKLRMGAADKDAISIAFAIAHKHAQEGMPTQKSKRFSKTGKRTGFTEDASKRIREILNKEIKKEIDNTTNNVNNSNNNS